MCLGFFFIVVTFCVISFLLKAFTLQPEEPFVVGELHIFPALCGSSLSLEELAYLVAHLYFVFILSFSLSLGSKVLSLPAS